MYFSFQWAGQRRLERLHESLYTVIFVCLFLSGCVSARVCLSVSGKCAFGVELVHQKMASFIQTCSITTSSPGFLYPKTVNTPEGFALRVAWHCILWRSVADKISTSLKYEVQNTNVIPKGINESTCANTKSRILKVIEITKFRNREKYSKPTKTIFEIETKQ